MYTKTKKKEIPEWVKELLLEEIGVLTAFLEELDKND